MSERVNVGWLSWLALFLVVGVATFVSAWGPVLYTWRPRPQIELYDLKVDANGAFDLSESTQKAYAERNYFLSGYNEGRATKTLLQEWIKAIEEDTSWLQRQLGPEPDPEPGMDRDTMETLLAQNTALTAALKADLARAETAGSVLIASALIRNDGGSAALIPQAAVIELKGADGQSTKLRAALSSLDPVNSPPVPESFLQVPASGAEWVYFATLEPVSKPAGPLTGRLVVEHVKSGASQTVRSEWLSPAGPEATFNRLGAPVKTKEAAAATP